MTDFVDLIWHYLACEHVPSSNCFLAFCFTKCLFSCSRSPASTCVVGSKRVTDIARGRQVNELTHSVWGVVSAAATAVSVHCSGHCHFQCHQVGIQKQSLIYDHKTQQNIQNTESLAISVEWRNMVAIFCTVLWSEWTKRRFLQSVLSQTAPSPSDVLPCKVNKKVITYNCKKVNVCCFRIRARNPTSSDVRVKCVISRNKNTLRIQSFC